MQLHPSDGPGSPASQGDSVDAHEGRASIHLVARERLGALLGGKPRRLTTFVAPPGFGKSVAMRAWSRQLSQHRYACLWVDMSNAITDADVLARQLMNQLDRKIGARVLPHPAMESNVSNRSGAKPTELLLNALDGSEHLAIFLDHFEQATDPSLEPFLRTLLSRLGPASTLVIGSRRTPLLDQMRLRLQGELCEITYEELGFTSAEVAELISQFLGHDCTDYAVSEAERLTGNWPVAVRLLLLRMEELGTSTPQAAAEHLLQDLHVYFETELLDDLPRDQHSFLLAVSCVDRLTADLASQLTGANSQVQLDALTRKTYLLPSRRGDGLQHHFYIPPLLLRFLRANSAAADPSAYRERCRLAASWLEQHGRISEAAACAGRAGDTGRAISLLSRVAMDNVKQGDFHAVIDAVEQLPQEEVAQHNALYAAYLWALALTDRPDDAALHLDLIESAPARQSTAELAETLYFLRVIVAARRGDLAYVRKRADEVLSRIASADGYHFGAVTMAIAHSYLSIGGKQRAQEIIARAQQASADDGRYTPRASFQLLEALSEFTDGQVMVAAASLRQMHEKVVATPDYPAIPAAMVATSLARVLYEQNEVAAAAKVLRRHLAMVIDQGLPGAVISGYVTAARIEFLHGNAIEALRLTKEARSYGRRRNLSRVFEIMEWESARYAWLRGDIDTVQRIGESLPASPLAAWHPLFADLHMLDLWPIRYALWQTDSETALSLIAGQRSDPAKQLGMRAVVLDFLTAIGLEQAGEHAAANRYLCSALKTGLGGGIVRAFLDEGAFAAALLRKTLPRFEAELGPNDHRRLAGPLATLQAGLDNEYPAAPSRARPAGIAAPSLQMARLSPLTAQELEILRHLKSGLSNREVGSAMQISAETVKWHLRNIFSKLQVKNRTEAVFVAQQIALF